MRVRPLQLVLVKATDACDGKGEKETANWSALTLHRLSDGVIVGIGAAGGHVGLDQDDGVAHAGLGGRERGHGDRLRIRQQAATGPAKTVSLISFM